MLLVLRVTMLDNTAFKFILVGIANSLFGFSMICLVRFISSNDVVANIVGYIFGLTLSFYLNKNWTFSYDDLSNQIVFRFAAVTIASYLLNLLIVVTSIKVFNMNPYYSQALGVPVYSVCTYFGYRNLVFRRGE